MKPLPGEAAPDEPPNGPKIPESKGASNLLSRRFRRNSIAAEKDVSNRKPTDFLHQTAIRLKAAEAEIKKLDTKLVEQDIAARRIEADVGWQFAQEVDQIEAALKASGGKLNVEQWCKQTVGVEITTMRRRKRLYKHWKVYEVERRKAGQCGQSGLLFALSLVQDAIPQPERTGKLSPVRSSTATKPKRSGSAVPPVPGCEFITGDALAELRKLAAQSVNTIVTSPAYWPTKRLYGGTGIGFEPTLGEYLKNLVAVFREARRVLRDDGVMWIVIDDAYAQPGGRWRPNTFELERPTEQKSASSDGLRYPGSTSVRPVGNLLLIPARLAMALQDDGWILRAEIIWHKGLGGGRPESVTDRVSKTHEKVLMFSKQRRYFYDPDPIREPLSKPYSDGGKLKAGVLRREENRDFRHFSNPMGRNAGSVWQINVSGYRGKHPATMPVELAQRCIVATCPENGTVLDPFGGAGTTGVAALKAGRRAILVEISEDYTNEARERIARELDVAPFRLAAD